MSIARLVNRGMPFSNVVPTGTATANITPGRTLDAFILKLGGTTFTKAMIPLLRVKANGKVVIEASGTELDKINGYKGLTADAAYLPVCLYDEKMLSEFDRAVSAFDTSVGVANITIEAQISGATAPTLDHLLTLSGAQKARDGSAAPFAPFMTKLLRYPFSIATGGKLPVTVPFGPGSGAIIKRVYVFNANMTGADVKQDGMVIHESLKLENEFSQKRYGRVPQAGVYVIDFCEDGNIMKALDTRDARSLEWLLSFSAADNGSIIVEYLDSLGNL